MEDQNLEILRKIREKINSDPAIEEVVSECNDIARRKAKKAITEFTETSFEMVKLVHEAAFALMSNFENIDVREAMELGIWAQETLIALYGPEALKNLRIEIKD